MSRQPGRRGKRWTIALCAASSCLLACYTPAQTASPAPEKDPTLQKRSAPDTAGKPAKPADTSELPKDASGEYLLDEAGSVVEITIEAHQLTGYVTKMGDEQSDKDTPLTFFFDQATAQGNTLNFTTKKVHGISYSFTGTIVRGDPKTTRDEDGYYRLKGTWTVRDDARASLSRREEVSFKSTPRKP